MAAWDLVRVKLESYLSGRAVIERHGFAIQ
jgi:hypothetical protein